jgi:alkanesulfonate monooxygenase
VAIEFIGMIASEAKSEIHPAQGPVIDPDYIARFAQAHEAAGFDHVRIAHSSPDADAVLVAIHATQHTKTLGFMIAHRPGFIAPTHASRLFATFDVFSGGRGGIHIISGGNGEEQRRNGYFLSHEERYAGRTNMSGCCFRPGRPRRRSAPLVAGTVIRSAPISLR